MNWQSCIAVEVSCCEPPTCPATVRCVLEVGDGVLGPLKRVQIGMEDANDLVMMFAEQRKSEREMAIEARRRESEEAAMSQVGQPVEGYYQGAVPPPPLKQQ